MQRKLALERDEIEDELELQDEELRKQIADGYKAYLHGRTKNVDELIADIRNKSTPEQTLGR